MRLDSSPERPQRFGRSLRASNTPRIVKFAIWLTFFNTCVLFEETIVDRYGLWEYMPYYRVGRLCSWDIGAIALLGFIVWWFFRGRKVG